MSSHHISFDAIVSRLRTDFPGVKLLALGQTVYWDEPVKAILRRALDEAYPQVEMVVGIHDADYFSKVSASLNLPDGWAVVPHSDGATKDLWVATGEISSLFGSETVPGRDVFTSHGVQFDRISRDFPGGRDALVEAATEAWGWRGLVHVNAENEIACCIALKDALPRLLELLEWGFNHTLDSLSEADSARGRIAANELLADVKEYAAANPDSSITDMFRDFLKKAYVRLLGQEPRNLTLASMAGLFTFNRSTAALPRFRLVDAFLNVETRQACQDAYDLAVENSDIYTLDKFCDGAIPFDLVIPGVGRGTICLRAGSVIVDADETIVLSTDKVPNSASELAALVEAKLGPDVALVGKAIPLVLMMASEFVFVLHEQASVYVPRCEKMASVMKERGVDLPFYPILRIKYHTWDSLSACESTFNLPGHMATAFHQGEITSKELADSWRAVVSDQMRLLERIVKLTDVDSLLTFLAAQQGNPWPERINAYKVASATVRELSQKAEPLKAESVSLRDLSHEIKAQIQVLEAEKGVHFRTLVKPLKDQMENLSLDGKTDADVAAQLAKEETVRTELENQIRRKREEAHAAQNKSQDLKKVVQSIEKGDEMMASRSVAGTIEYEAELARLWLVRDAVLVTKGLEYTDHRPSAWWFLLVDPELKWFNRVAETAEYRWEEIEANGVGTMGDG